MGNVLNLPIEIVGLDIHGATVLPASREWLEESSTDLLTGSVDRVVLRAFAPDQVPVIRYVRLDIPLAEIERVDKELDAMQGLDVQVITRILGLSRTQMTLAQEGYPDAFVVGSDR